MGLEHSSTMEVLSSSVQTSPPLERWGPQCMGCPAPAGRPPCPLDCSFLLPPSLPPTSACSSLCPACLEVGVTDWSCSGVDRGTGGVGVEWVRQRQQDWYTEDFPREEVSVSGLEGRPGPGDRGLRQMGPLVPYSRMSPQGKSCPFRF